MTERIPRRAVLRIAGGAACAACSAQPPASHGSTACASAATGTGLRYCLVENKRLRVAGGARIAPGQAIVVVLDDDSAGILARDAMGLYGLSATCTHACCTVNVCNDSSCLRPSTTPAPCEVTVLTLPAAGAAFLCPCHGSTYAADGSLLKGPSTQPLPSVVVEVDGADAIIDLSTAADPGTRV